MECVTVKFSVDVVRKHDARKILFQDQLTASVNEYGVNVRPLSVPDFIYHRGQSCFVHANGLWVTTTESIIEVIGDRVIGAEGLTGYRSITTCRKK